MQITGVKYRGSRSTQQYCRSSTRVHSEYSVLRLYLLLEYSIFYGVYAEECSSILLSQYVAFGGYF